MQIVDVPADADRLDGTTHLRVDHGCLAGAAPLDAGQVLVLRDLDGGLRFGAVDRLEFSATGTTYLVQLGHRTDATALARWCAPLTPTPRRSAESRTPLEVADVASLLRALAADTAPDDLVSPGLR